MKKIADFGFTYNEKNSLFVTTLTKYK